MCDFVYEEEAVGCEQLSNATAIFYEAHFAEDILTLLLLSWKVKDLLTAKWIGTTGSLMEKLLSTVTIVTNNLLAPLAALIFCSAHLWTVIKKTDE